MGIVEIRTEVRRVDLLRSSTEHVRRSDMLPEAFRPELTRTQLPEYTVADLRSLKLFGWSRLGVAPAVVAPGERILMVQHKASAKVREGTFGPLAETSQVRRVDSALMPESVHQTMARAFYEELAIPDPQRLQLMAAAEAAWTLTPWPVGKDDAGARALAICPVVFITAEQEQALRASFHETPETKAIEFFTPDECVQLVQQEVTRPGLRDWLEAIARSDLLDGQATERAAIQLPELEQTTDAVDIIFDRLPEL